MLAALIAALAARPEPSGATDLTPVTERSAPPFSLDSLRDGPIDLSARDEHVILVHFFATWCEPCRAEMAALQRLHERFAQRRLAILAIDVGEVDLRVARFFAAQPVSFPVLLDRDKTAAKAWEITTLPTTVVLGRAHVPRFVVEGDLDWDRPEAGRTLESLLAETEPASGAPTTDALILHGRTQ